MSDCPQACAKLDEETILAEHVLAIRKLQRSVIGDIVEIGRRLCECKTIVGHGNWLPWLKREFSLSQRTARNFMNAYRFVRDKSANVSGLKIEASSLYLIASPSTSEVARTEVLREATVHALSRAEVKTIVERDRRSSIAPGGPETRITTRGAIAGLGWGEFAALPLPEQAKILELHKTASGSVDLAIRDAQTRLAWKPAYRKLQEALDATQDAARAPVKKIVAAIPRTDKTGVLSRLERARNFLEELSRKLRAYDEAPRASHDDKERLNRILSASRKKFGRAIQAQNLEAIWSKLNPAQISLLQSGAYGPVIKAATERLIKKTPTEA